MPNDQYYKGSPKTLYKDVKKIVYIKTLEIIFVNESLFIIKHVFWCIFAYTLIYMILCSNWFKGYLSQAASFQILIRGPFKTRLFVLRTNINDNKRTEENAEERKIEGIFA